MLTVAVYQPLPDDPSSGKILWTTQATARSLQASSLPWIEVPGPGDYGSTHKVVAGALAPIDD